MTIAVQPMRWWHIAAVAELERELFPDDAWSVEQFWQELAQDTRTYLVALDDGVVIGYAGTSALPPDSDLQTVAVDSGQQGKGVAREMLSVLTDGATAAGCTHMMLEVRAVNTRAIDLYERMGFERISSRPRYYADGVDAIIMRKPLNPSASGQSLRL